MDHFLVYIFNISLPHIVFGTYLYFLNLHSLSEIQIQLSVLYFHLLNLKTLSIKEESFNKYLLSTNCVLMIGLDAEWRKVRQKSLFLWT